MQILGANELTQKHSVVADPHILCTNGMVSRGLIQYKDVILPV